MSKQPIYNYLNTFWTVIREFQEKYPEYNVHTPQIFKFTYLFLIYKCIDGFLVTAYPSGFTDNYIYSEINQKIKTRLEKLPNKIIGTDNHVVISMDNFGGDGMIHGIRDTVTLTNGRSLPTTGYKFFYMATPEFEWQVSEAKKSADEVTNMIKANAKEHKVKENHLLKDYDNVLRTNRQITLLSTALDRYQNTINEENYNEHVIHRFLRDHPVIWFPTKGRSVYEYVLKEDGKKKYVIDFVIEITKQRYILVELENPRHKIFKKKDALRDSVNHAMEQINDWINHIRANPEEVETDFPGISSIKSEGLVVIGRGTMLTDNQKQKLRLHNENNWIKVKTYDDIAEECKNHLLQLANLG